MYFGMDMPPIARQRRLSMAWPADKTHRTKSRCAIICFEDSRNRPELNFGNFQVLERTYKFSRYHRFQSIRIQPIATPSSRLSGMLGLMSQGLCMTGQSNLIRARCGLARIALSGIAPSKKTPPSTLRFCKARRTEFTEIWSLSRAA